MFVPRTTPLPRSTAAPDPHSPPRPTQCDSYRQKRQSRALPPRPTQCDSYRQKRQSRALTLDRHNATDNDKNTKAALSPSSDTMRRIPTKTPKPRSPPRPTQYDKYRQKHQSRAPTLDRHNTTDIDKHSEATHSPSTDIMRQLPTKTLKPHSPPRPTQCDSYRQKHQSRALPLVRHNTTNIDKNTKAALLPLTDTMRQITTKTPKPSSPTRPTQYDSYRQNAKAELSPRPT